MKRLLTLSAFGVACRIAYACGRVRGETDQADRDARLFERMREREQQKPSFHGDPSTLIDALAHTTRLDLMQRGAVVLPTAAAERIDPLPHATPSGEKPSGGGQANPRKRRTPKRRNAPPETKP